MGDLRYLEPAGEKNSLKFLTEGTISREMIILKSIFKILKIF
jgi:hypothetical protein